MKKTLKNQMKYYKIVEEIVDFNKRTQNQLGEGLKISTPNQMLSRL